MHHLDSDWSNSQQSTSGSRRLSRCGLGDRTAGATGCFHCRRSGVCIYALSHSSPFGINGVHADSRNCGRNRHHRAVFPVAVRDLISSQRAANETGASAPPLPHIRALRLTDARSCSRPCVRRCIRRRCRFVVLGPAACCKAARHLTVGTFAVVIVAAHRCESGKSSSLAERLSKDATARGPHFAQTRISVRSMQMPMPTRALLSSRATHKGNRRIDSVQYLAPLQQQANSHGTRPRSDCLL